MCVDLYSAIPVLKRRPIFPSCDHAWHILNPIWQTDSIHTFTSNKSVIDNGDKALFKTSNLNAKELIDEFNTLCQIYEQKAAEEESKKRRR